MGRERATGSREGGRWHAALVSGGIVVALAAGLGLAIFGPDGDLPRIAQALPAEPGVAVSIEVSDGLLQPELTELVESVLRHAWIATGKAPTRSAPGAPADELAMATRALMGTLPWRVGAWFAVERREGLVVLSGGGLGRVLRQVLPGANGLTFGLRGTRWHVRVVENCLILATHQERAAATARAIGQAPRDHIADGSPMTIVASVRPVPRARSDEGAMEELGELEARAQLSAIGVDRWLVVYGLAGGGLGSDGNTARAERWTTLLAQDGISVERHEIHEVAGGVRGEVTLEGLRRALANLSRELDYWSVRGQ